MCRLLLNSKCYDAVDFGTALFHMKHGGPDYSAIKTPEPAFMLGHNRLSIVDLSLDGSQPMGKQKVEVLFNGEIYNYKDLIVTFNLKTKTKCDTEVLLELYLKIGEKMFQYLDGEFAIVIYDGRKGTKVFAARDPYGIKPLYYYWKNRHLILSSEIRGITHFIGKHLDTWAMATLQEFGYTLGKTLFDGVNKVEPGHVDRYDIDKDLRTSESFYKPAYDVSDEPVPTQLRHRVEEAVKKRLMADVPISCTLSGGLDSTIVAKIASERVNKLKTYTIAFGNDTDDLVAARAAADQLGTVHEELIVPLDQILEDIPDILDHAEEPMDKGSLIPTWYLAHAIKEKVTLIGEGADECFGGYDRHINFGSDVTFEQYFKNRLELFHLPSEFQSIRYSRFNPTDGNTILWYDLTHEIPNFHNMRIDKLFMSNAVEARVPFLDPRVVEFSQHIEYKWKQNPEKRVLREAFPDLPAVALGRKKKALKIPYLEWVKSTQVMDVLMDPNSFISPGQAKAIIDKPEDARNKGRQLWYYYLINVWHKKIFSSLW